MESGQTNIWVSTTFLEKTARSQSSTHHPGSSVEKSKFAEVRDNVLPGTM